MLEIERSLFYVRPSVRPSAGTIDLQINGCIRERELLVNVGFNELQIFRRVLLQRRRLDVDANDFGVRKSCRHFQRPDTSRRAKVQDDLWILYRCHRVALARAF